MTLRSSRSYLLGSCVLGMAMLSVGCASRPSALPPIRVLTWNVHACRNGVDKVVAQLRQINADVICLEEVECGGLKTPEYRTANRIAAALGMNFACSEVPDDGSEEEQVAILFQGKLESVELLQVSRCRLYGVTARIDWHGRPVRIVATHLTSNSTDGIGRFFKTGARRMNEVADLIRRGDEWEGDIIVAGDFNAAVGMLETSLLNTYFHRAPNWAPTFPACSPIALLDHLFYRGNLQVACVHVEPSTASDHRPLLAQLQLLEPT